MNKVLVFGSGISGIGAVNLLLNVGKEVILYDGNTNLNPELLKEQFDANAQVEIIWVI